MKAPTASRWAKRRPRIDPVDWHPLADHCHDVAAVFEALLALPVIKARLAALAGKASLPALWKARLAVLAFLHDFGKANHKFQRGEGGHIHEAMFPVLDASACRSSGLDRLDDWSEYPYEIIAATLSHHGYIPDAPTDRVVEHLRRHWLTDGTGDPLAEVAALVVEAERCWRAAFVLGGEKLPDKAAFWHGFLGLLQLADWLGSDDRPDAFPFSRAGDSPRRVFAQVSAAALLKPLGLDVSALRDVSAPPPNFAAISPFDPSPIQRQVGEALGPIVAMEAETGSGKPEAALYRFARLFMAGKVDGLYLALPTRVAASQMFERVRQSVERLFPKPECRPAVVRALPGDAGVDDARVRAREATAEPGMRQQPSFEVQWSDDASEAERRPALGRRTAEALSRRHHRHRHHRPGAARRRAGSSMGSCAASVSRVRCWWSTRCMPQMPT